MIHRVLTVAAVAAAMLAAQGPGRSGNRPGGPPTSEQMIERRVQHLTTLLTLTTAQQTQLTQIYTDEAAAAQALRPAMETARTALHDAVQNNLPEPQIDRAAAQIGTVQGQLTAVHAKAQAKFLNLLTAEQKAKLEALKGRGGPGMGPRGQGMYGPGRPMGMGMGYGPF